MPRRVPQGRLSHLRHAKERDGGLRPRGGGLQPATHFLPPLLQNLLPLEPLRIAQKVPPEAEATPVPLPSLWKGMTTIFCGYFLENSKTVWVHSSSAKPK